MLREEISATFQEVRSLMHRPELTMKTRQYLREVLLVMYRDHPDEYLEQWLPYLHGFPHHFEKELGWFTDIEALRFAARYAPFARFGWDVVGEGAQLAEMISDSGLECLGSMVCRRDRVGEVMALELVHSERLVKLRMLALHDMRFDGDAHMARLLAAPVLRQLEVLDLSGCTVSDASIKVLAKHRGFEALKTLRMERCSLMPLARQALARLAAKSDFSLSL